MPDLDSNQGYSLQRAGLLPLNYRALVPRRGFEPLSFLIQSQAARPTSKTRNRNWGEGGDRTLFSRFTAGHITNMLPTPKKKTDMLSPTNSGAGSGNRTPAFALRRRCSATELNRLEFLASEMRDNLVRVVGLEPTRPPNFKSGESTSSPETTLAMIWCLWQDLHLHDLSATDLSSLRVY